MSGAERVRRWWRTPARIQIHRGGSRRRRQERRSRPAGGGRRIPPEGVRGGCRRILPGEGHRHGPAMVDGGGTAAPDEFLMICCCLTTTAADQINLSRHLEQRQIKGSAGKKWRARPPAEIDISSRGTLADRRGGALDARRDGQERRRREKEGRRRREQRKTRV